MADIGAETAAVLTAAADDLEFLARLHDREPDVEFLKNMSASPVENWFGLALAGGEVTASRTLIADWFASTTDLIQAAEQLAVEYAEIYLNFSKRVAPNESYWRTDDHIERQEPMFAVRDWYAHYGLKAEDWRIRADDHLVSEMLFVATLLRDGREHALLDAGRFLDRHLLVWSDEFLKGVVQRSEQPFYVGVALLTQAVLAATREILVSFTGEPAHTDVPLVNQATEQTKESPFIPGVQPSW